ncbi:hypothetical protein BGZ83_012174 [Gryganskiella cystojenkinii]|nr:hypothetical protein BGZ83_012174 [Gryganskiella cystojenkinii]
MDLPEIRLYVATYLDSHDLISCSCVSRRWNDSFTPFLYRTWIATSHSGHLPSFEKHLHHVQDLQVGHQTTAIERDRFLDRCIGLRRFKIDLSLHGRDNEFVFKLLQRNPRLTRVSLGGIDQDTNPDLLDTIADYCSLATELSLLTRPFNGHAFWDRFMIRLAPRLTRLELNWSQPYALTTRGQPPEFPELRDLIITSKPIQVSWEAQLGIFERCPKLESFSWCLVSSSDLPRSIWGFTHTLISILQGRHGHSSWPRLDSIQLTELHPTPQLEDKTLSEILNNCPNRLCRLTIPGSHIGVRSWQALQRHLETINVLHLATYSWMIQEILSSCRNLREFRGSVLWAYELVDSVSAKEMRDMIEETKTTTGFIQSPQQLELTPFHRLEDDASFTCAIAVTSSSSPSIVPPQPRPWVCHRLEVLCITLGGVTDTEDHRQVFEQLKKLRLLTQLYLCPQMTTQGCGMDPRAALSMSVESHEDAFEGEYNNRQRIQNEPVGRRLLEVWPGLTNCHWYKQ